MDLIGEFNQSLGMTVVMVTHERTLAERFARRMVSMADGKLAGDELNSGVSLANALTERSV
jgi:predicted ABC-type transport system involved in lysophospholipase L1 biosynthesis ATPase subunit